MDAARLTLRLYFTLQHEPMFLPDAKPATIDEYLQVLRLWEATFAQEGEPMLTQITNGHLATFRAELKKRPGRDRKSPVSPATVNKHLRTLGHMLTAAGPPSPRKRDALGLLDVVPWCQPLKTFTRAPRTIPAEDLARIYEACDVAVRPRLEYCTPAAWWRALIVTAYNLAMRRGALLSLPAENVDYRNQELRVPAEADKCRTERAKPMNASTSRHLLTVRGGQLVLEWPYSWSQFYRDWRKIITAAGTPYYVPHDLKRTSLTTMAAQGVAPTTIQQMGDHASITTTMKYVNAARQLRPAVEVMPQPWEEEPWKEDGDAARANA